MVFSSNIFLLYFLPAFLICYFICPRKYRNYILLLFSIFFYGYGAPDFILILLGSTMANFYLVKAMDKSQSRLYKKLFCAAAIVINMGLLAYFKYANFFVDNLNAMLSMAGARPLTFAKVLLPIGISFFSFQSVTYVCIQNGEERTIDARTSDAIALALRFNAPIYTYRDIVQKAGIYIPLLNEENQNPVSPSLDDIEEENDGTRNRYSKYSLTELKKMLNDCIENEDYEIAAHIRDEISKRNSTF